MRVAWEGNHRTLRDGQASIPGFAGGSIGGKNFPVIKDSLPAPKRTLLGNPVEQQSKTPPDMLPSDPAQIVAGTRQAKQAGHKGFQRLGNAPNPSGE